MKVQVTTVATKAIPAVSQSIAESASITTKNVVAHARDYVKYLNNHPNMLKENALIFSSLILVLSRIFVARNSAKKAEGTSQEKYRSKEFIRTSIRELGGWTLSFMVLKAFEFGVRAWIKRSFHLMAMKNELRFWDFFKKAFMELRNFVEGATQTLRKMDPKAVTSTAVDFSKRPYYRKDFELKIMQPTKTQIAEGMAKDHYEKLFQAKYENGWNKLIDFFSRDSLFKKTENTTLEERLLNFYNWFPVVVGSIPAILLSGFGLEWFNQTKSDKVAHSFNTWLRPELSEKATFGAGESTVGTPQYQPFIPDIPVTGQQAEFGRFYNQVRMKQMDRGHNF